MEALKSLLRLVGDLAFTVLDGIDQVLTSGRSARMPSEDVVFTDMNDEHAAPVINPATGLHMIDGMGSVDSAGNLYGSHH